MLFRSIEDFEYDPTIDLKIYLLAKKYIKKISELIKENKEKQKQEREREKKKIEEMKIRERKIIEFEEKQRSKYCMICNKTFNGSKFKITRDCGHSYHLECLKLSLPKKAPLVCLECPKIEKLYKEINKNNDHKDEYRAELQHSFTQEDNYFDNTNELMKFPNSTIPTRYVNLLLI